jgi:hypothetical protein
VPDGSGAICCALHYFGSTVLDQAFPYTNSALSNAGLQIS